MNKPTILYEVDEKTKIQKEFIVHPYNHGRHNCLACNHAFWMLQWNHRHVRTTVYKKDGKEISVLRVVCLNCGHRWYTKLKNDSTVSAEFHSTKDLIKNNPPPPLDLSVIPNHMGMANIFGMAMHISLETKRLYCA